MANEKSQIPSPKSQLPTTSDQQPTTSHQLLPYNPPQARREQLLSFSLCLSSSVFRLPSSGFQENLCPKSNSSSTLKPTAAAPANARLICAPSSIRSAAR